MGNKVNQQKPKTAPSLGKKEPVKKPRPIKTGENIKDILNVFTDPRGQKWEMPIGDMMKSQAKLQEIRAKNEGVMAKESMTLEKEKIKQEMAQMQAELLMQQQAKEERIAEQQSKVNASNQAMAMFGYNPSAQMGQPPAGIFGDVLQSQGQMAQGQLGLIQQQMQNQGQMDVQKMKEASDSELFAQDFLNKLELLKEEEKGKTARTKISKKYEIDKASAAVKLAELKKPQFKKENINKLVTNSIDTINKTISSKLSTMTKLNRDEVGVENAMKLVSPTLKDFVNNYINDVSEDPTEEKEDFMELLYKGVGDYDPIIDEITGEIDKEALDKVWKEMTKDQQDLIYYYNAITAGVRNEDTESKSLFKEAISKDIKTIRRNIRKNINKH